ncbi:MAG: hypothetical protein GY821_10080 [Gammaproteobacteria bacterium]|nr:hypothetical protein [Gammaproteobacteria bacterium]
MKKRSFDCRENEYSSEDSDSSADAGANRRLKNAKKKISTILSKEVPLGGEGNGECRYIKKERYKRKS